MSKIIDITLGNSPLDIPTFEGWVIINYSNGGQGKTGIGVMVKQPMTWADAAAALSNNMGRNEWPEFIQHKVSGNKVRLSVPDGFDALQFSAAWNPNLDQAGEATPAVGLVTIADETF